MTKRKVIINVLLGILVALIVVYIGYEIINSIQFQICQYCIKTNWAGYLTGDIEVNCSEFPSEKKLECEQLIASNIEHEDETFSKCCNNTPCSDTYYSQEDNLCHLVLCENLYGKNNPKCVYPAK